MVSVTFSTTLTKLVFVQIRKLCELCGSSCEVSKHLFWLGSLRIHWIVAFNYFYLYWFYYVFYYVSGKNHVHQLAVGRSYVNKTWLIDWSQRALSSPTTWTTNAATCSCTKPSGWTAPASWWSTTTPPASPRSRSTPTARRTSFSTTASCATCPAGQHWGAATHRGWEGFCWRGGWEHHAIDFKYCMRQKPGRST